MLLLFLLPIYGLLVLGAVLKLVSCLKLQHLAMKHGLILVDTKYEFGKASDGSILLIDEVNYYISSWYTFLSHPYLLHHG